MFITNNQASFHLWGKENSVKYQKVSKYYAHDCGFITNQTNKRIMVFQNRYFEQDRYFHETNEKFGSYCK